jgi:hypothetical protein
VLIGSLGMGKCPGVAMTHDHTVVYTQTFLLSQPGGQKSEIKVSTGEAPGESFLGLWSCLSLHLYMAASACVCLCVLSGT